MDDHKTFLNTIQVLGIALGAVSGGAFLKFGRRKIMIIFNLVNLVGCGIRVVKNWPMILVGSFI